MSILFNADKVRKTALPEVREAIADQVADSYAHRLYLPSDIKMAEEIIRLLATDPAVRVRKVLSFNLQRSSELPRDIMMRLARDVDEVALPILMHSPLLTEDDLLSFIGPSTGLYRLLAIANRDIVTTPVSHALVYHRHPEVSLRLLRNKGADIAVETYHLMMDYYAKLPKILEALVDKGGLPLEIVERLVSLVSGELKDQLMSIYPLRKYQVKLMEVPGTKPLQNISEINLKPSSDSERLGGVLPQKERELMEAKEKIHSLKEKGLLSVSTALQALCEGKIILFEVAVSVLANMPVDNIATIAHVEPEAFRSLCHRAGIPITLAPALTILLDFANHEQILGNTNRGADYKEQLIEYVTSHGYDRTIPLMPYMMALIVNSLHNYTKARTNPDTLKHIAAAMS